MKPGPRFGSRMALGGALCVLAVACNAIFGVDALRYGPEGGGAAAGGGVAGAGAATGGGGAAGGTTTSAGGIAAGGGGTGGAGTAGAATGGCGPLAPAPNHSTCPAECNSGCGVSRHKCKINCTGTDACQGTTVVCPADYDCDVQCFANGCLGTTVVCPPQYDCKVQCKESGGCDQLVVQCTDGPCELDCKNGLNVCAGATVVCGTGSCTANCEPGGVAPSMQCGGACSCLGC